MADHVTSNIQFANIGFPLQITPDWEFTKESLIWVWVQSKQEQQAILTTQLAENSKQPNAKLKLSR